MNSNMFLADFAQVSDGKLTVVGAGWTQRTTDPAPTAIGGIVHVDWSPQSQSHQLLFELIDEDGYPVIDPSGVPVRVEVQLEVDNSLTAVQGSPTSVPIALNFGPLPLAPGHGYEWVLSVDGTVVENGRLPFQVVG